VSPSGVPADTRAVALAAERVCPCGGARDPTRSKVPSVSRDRESRRPGWAGQGAGGGTPSMRRTDRCAATDCASSGGS